MNNREPFSSLFKIRRSTAVELGPRPDHHNLRSTVAKTSSNWKISMVCFLLLFGSSNLLCAQSLIESVQPSNVTPNFRVLNKAQIERMDESVERALQWLATQQRADGSFRSITSGQPGITGLCVMAFLAQGKTSDDSEYGAVISKAIDFICAQQKRNGLVSAISPHTMPIPRVSVSQHQVITPAIYNHAIASLALAEAYGQCSGEQCWGGKKIYNEGGWRYLDRRHGGGDSDLSMTGWQLMFLRSARNAGFDLPEESINAAVQYVENCFLHQKNRKVHGYMVKDSAACTRAMAGAGVLALAHAGKHDSEEATLSGEWILKHDFSKYNEDTPPYGHRSLRDRYHYGAVSCAQAMFQLGGKYWDQFFPTLVDALLANQKAGGSWPPEPVQRKYGRCYTTALSILSLSVPNQMLPIFQR